MIHKINVPISKISWLSSYPIDSKGYTANFYEPETIEELVNICGILNDKKEKYDIIGHTSNIYFMPNYSIDNIVSTRKLTGYYVTDNTLVCECGVHVAKLSRKMVDDGYVGFEGLIDLPGTVGAAIYGNAGCYQCTLGALVKEVHILERSGTIRIFSRSEMEFKKRSSILKESHMGGVILRVVLELKKGDLLKLKALAERNHHKRVMTQPGPKNNLGSIYSISGSATLYGKFIRVISKITALICYCFNNKHRSLKELEKSYIFKFTGHSDIEDYVFSWNRYIWKDPDSHSGFIKYMSFHEKMFKGSKLEIEIKEKGDE